MDNRFKFRIWDKPTNKMFYDVAMGFIKAPMRSDWVCADTPDGQISYTGDRLKDIEIMQCTGLKDKNGNLIFEGDIVKVDDGSDTVAEIKWADFLCGYRIISDFMQYDFDTFDSENLEVIGNIYQNPELIEKQEQQYT